MSKKPLTAYLIRILPWATNSCPDVQDLLLKGEAGIAPITAKLEILYSSPYNFVIADEKGDPNWRLVLAARRDYRGERELDLSRCPHMPPDVGFLTFREMLKGAG